ncbi:DUF2306 domain-containing protein [Streptosporangium carneum]|uniref:DUF2306 domain-containing protein n=1 Tax=Streptosporangium carneum TaxID=47481 RepID=A0A9W6I6U3_9ACTN|nr:DUF2306 domain-containing protein [Streptosporangium carneum]GLK12314.1 hypothetical protein GCM10017600_57230 [Streptosporangium carneum]
MTQNAEQVGTPAPRDDGPVKQAQAVTTGAPPRWWRRPWIIPLVLVVAGFLIFQLSPFAGVAESQAPIPPHDGFPLYYPLLIAHMALGTVAMIAVCLQVWPWLRLRHPAVHRVSGRLYVLGALPGAVIGLVIMPFAPPVGQIGVSMATILWFATTLAGFVAARRRRYALHRRYMLYSFALVMNNVWGIVIVNTGLAVGDISINYLLEAARWVGWVVNLMLVQWWLYRTAGRRVV